MVAAILAMAGSALADESPPGADVRTHYVGATFAGQGGVVGNAFVTIGGDVFTGVRLSRWVSLEEFFAYHFATRPSPEMSGGAICMGLGTDTWHWQALGVRLWIHLAHLRWLDVSIGPTLAAGISTDQWRSTLSTSDPLSSLCPLYAPDVGTGWAFDGGLDLGVEIRPLRWLGVRAMFETSLDLGENHVGAFDMVSTGGWVGPVLRF